MLGEKNLHLYFEINGSWVKVTPENVYPLAHPIDRYGKILVSFGILLEESIEPGLVDYRLEITKASLTKKAVSKEWRYLANAVITGPVSKQVIPAPETGIVERLFKEGVKVDKGQQPFGYKDEERYKRQRKNPPACIP